MMRVIAENLFLFLLPTFIYLAYMGLSGREAGNRDRAIADAPLIWLFAAGALLVLATLIVFGSSTGGKPGQSYRPPAFGDGKIEPGRLQ